MIETNDITTFARHMFSRSRGYKVQQIMHPNREWFIIFVLFLFLFALSVLFGVWQYRTFQQLPDTITAAEDTVVPTYSSELVQSVLQERNAQLAMFKRLLGDSGTTTEGEQSNSVSDRIDLVDTSVPTTTVDAEASSASGEVIPADTTPAPPAEETMPDADSSGTLDSPAGSEELVPVFD